MVEATAEDSTGVEDSTVDDSSGTVVAVESVTTLSSLKAEEVGVTKGTVTSPVPTRVDAAGVIAAASGVLNTVLVVKGEETSVTVDSATIVDVPDGLSLVCVETVT